MKVLLYSTGCPRCGALERHLKHKGIKFELHTDVDEMKSLGYMSVPMLVVDGVAMDFVTAMSWVKGQSTTTETDKDTKEEGVYSECASCVG